MSDKLFPKALKEHLETRKTYIVAPMKECRNERIDGYTHNGAKRRETVRRRAVEFIDSRTVLYLLGYGHKEAYKILPERMSATADWSTLDSFITFVSVNNIELIDALEESHPQPATFGLADFIELALKWFAELDGLTLKRQGSDSQPYMVVVE